LYPGRAMRGVDAPTIRHEARTIAEAFLHRVSAGMIDSALALVDPNASAELTPLKLRGPASEVMRRYVLDLAKAFPDLKLHIRRLFVGLDGTVVAEVTIQGAQAAELWGIPSRGRVLELEQVWLLHLEENMRMDRVGAYWCQYQLCKMLGARRLDRVSVGASDG
jgi:predicted ester cyclase